MRNQRKLFAWLTGIAAIFVVQAGVFLAGARRSQARERRLYEDSIASLELVSNLGRDVAQERILVDDHIFEHDAARMQAIEEHLAVVQLRVRQAREAYGRFVELPGEAEAWARTERSLSRFEAVIPAVLDLSRHERDVEARARMATVLADYEALDGHVKELIHLSRASASGAVGRLLALQRSAEVVTWITGLTGLLALALLGFWGARRIAMYEARLLADARELQLRNRELDAFAGRIAHDLRNPLSSMRVAVELLAQQPGEARAQERLRRGVDRIDGMIDDLLALSRLDAEEGELSCCPAAVAAKLQTDFAEHFGDRALLRSQVEKARLACSEGLLRQAVWNLVENGVKYQRPGVTPEIEVAGRLAGKVYELTVADNGIGMSPEEAARAVTPFYRAARVDGVGGVGLGLSIVQRIAEARDGTLAIESRLGEGSTFTLRLPLARSREPGAAANPRADA